MHPIKTLAAASLVAALLPLAAHAKDGNGNSASSTKVPALVRFGGAIGVDPLTAAGGADAPNVVRGISPGGRAWVLRRFEARVGTDASLQAEGRGLLFTSGDAIGTRGALAQVRLTLACGAADATARQFHSAATALDANGNFRISGPLSEDGTNTAVMPATCDNPVLLVRAVNATTGAAGGWLAAGVPNGSDD